MTRDKMIEAAAQEMAFDDRAKNDCSADSADFWNNTGPEGRRQWLKRAAAVLDLCGPEKLVDALEACPPCSNPAVSTEDHLHSIEIWWRNWARPALNQLKEPKP